jgi:uncharacterized protein (TIGR02118 family)
MVKISIMYPNTKNARFDMNYYLTVHMPMSIEQLSAAPEFRGVSVERGLGGAGPDTEPPYLALCHYLFESLEGFLAAFHPHAAVLQGDMSNYTDLEPIMQVSAVEITR